MNKNLATIGWIGMMGLIFYSSSQPYTKQDMRTEISSIFDYFPQGMIQALNWISFSYAGKLVSIEALGVGGFIEFFIRKGAHFGGFFLLALFFYAFLRHRLESSKVCVVATLIFTVIYAAGDEFHQMLTGGRTPLIHDVCIDRVGGFFGTLLGYFMMRWYLGQKSSRQIK